MQGFNYCPGWTLCSSVNVQNNTPAFQRWDGRWQLPPAAGWFWILINQQGGSQALFGSRALADACQGSTLSPVVMTQPSKAPCHAPPQRQECRKGKALQGWLVRMDVLSRTEWTQVVWPVQKNPKKRQVKMLSLWDSPWQLWLRCEGITPFIPRVGGQFLALTVRLAEAACWQELAVFIWPAYGSDTCLVRLRQPQPVLTSLCSSICLPQLHVNAHVRIWWGRRGCW